MANLKSLANAQRMLENLKKEYRYKKRNNAVEKEAEVQYQLGVCRGELELSLTELDQTIRTQSRNIVKDSVTRAESSYKIDRTELGTIQEQMLWDAAIAYMLVKDALVAIKTISSQDSISNAYEMLEAAANQLTGKKQRRFFKMPQVRAAVSRGHYGFITSDEAMDEKEELLGQFFDKLRMNGDIEACLQNAENPIDVEARRRTLSTTGRTASGGTANSYMNRLNRLGDMDEDDADQYDIDRAIESETVSSAKQKTAPTKQTVPVEQAAPVEQMDDLEDLKRRVQNLSE